jgi:hypothetical protein
MHEREERAFAKRVLTLDGGAPWATPGGVTVGGDGFLGFARLSIATAEQAKRGQPVHTKMLQ